MCKYQNILLVCVLFPQVSGRRSHYCVYVKVSPWYFLLTFFVCPITGSDMAGRFSSSP